MKPHGSYLYNAQFADKLADAFDRHQSDKASLYAYHEVYSHLLSSRKIESFLKIGLFSDDAEPKTDLHVWADSFTNTQIYGADWRVDLLFRTARCKTYYVDPGAPESFDGLKKYMPKKLDVILDDASHILEKTITTFEQMWERIADGGVYVIQSILRHHYSEPCWQQNVEDLDKYFSSTGLNYEIFSTSAIRKCVDSVVLAVYKP